MSIRIRRSMSRHWLDMPYGSARCYTARNALMRAAKAKTRMTLKKRGGFGHFCSDAVLLIAWELEYIRILGLAYCNAINCVQVEVFRVAGIAAIVRNDILAHDYLLGFLVAVHHCKNTNQLLFCSFHWIVFCSLWFSVVYPDALPKSANEISWCGLVKSLKSLKI
jgi:hypothetical protein